MRMSLRFAAVVVALLAAGAMCAATASPQKVVDLTFPHVAENQNRVAAQVTTHADGCTICTQTCEDPETGEIFPCHCTDYQECGTSTEESGCSPAYTCGAGNYCIPAGWWAGCKFVFNPGGGYCANC